jgi:Methyltransferase domain
VCEELAAHTHGLAGIRSVVDVGAGAGTWRDSLGPHMPEATWTAVEIFEPYVERFRLRERYDRVIVGDIRRLLPFPGADLYILGDVIEHMTQPEAEAVWLAARAASRWVVLSLPVLDYPQGGIDGNPHEAHLHQWDMEQVLARLRGMVAVTGPQFPGSTVGAFIARGTRP